MVVVPDGRAFIGCSSASTRASISQVLPSHIPLLPLCLFSLFAKSAMSTHPPRPAVEDPLLLDDSTQRDPVPAFTSTPALDVHDTPLFHQLIGIIQEQNATAKEQRDIMQGMRRALEILEQRSSIRQLQQDMLGGQSGDTNGFGRTYQAQRPQDSTADQTGNLLRETLQRLKEVMEGVKDTLGNVKETLMDHGKKFDILTRDAIKDDQPYDQKELDDESTCTALFEMAMTKTKEEVDEWIKRMDVSLVFIALFSAVLTAFVVPATQNLFPSSNNTPGNPTDAPPPLPKVSAENVCVSYYLALILAILDAVLSVLGRQWMSKLTNRPEGGTYKDRLLRHLERERLAKKWLRYLVEGLHVILLWSIGLFVSGLLSQLWNLSGSFEKTAPRLLATWVLGLLLSLSILGVVLGATFHALIYEASPFGGPFSRLIFLAAKAMAGSFEPWMEQVAKAARWLDNIYKIRRRPFQRILPSLGRVIGGPLWMSSKLVDAWRVQLNLKDGDRLLTTYMDLIAEASDPKLLERAVASFSFVEWLQNRDQSHEELAQLKKTWDRLTATDTSLRVRETLTARARQFVPSDSQKLRGSGERVTRELVQFFCAIHSYPEEFRDLLLETAFQRDNADLRPLAALPFEECVARVLCSYNHKGKLGDRERIFDWAEIHCYNLLEEGKVDDVTRILSHVDRLDIIKSFIQYAGFIYPSVVEVIVKDHEDEVLRKINDFVKEVDQFKLGLESLSEIFSVLASPPPNDIDLSPLIDYLSRHPHWFTWEETSDTIISYLDSFNLSQISDSTAVRRFLERCIDNGFCDENGRWCSTSVQTRARARELLVELNSPSSPPTGAIESTYNQPASPSHSPSNAPSLSNASQPDPLLSPSTDSPSYIRPASPYYSLSRTPTPDDTPQLDHLLLPSADSLPPAPENIEFIPIPFANSPSGIPLTTLNHPPPNNASFESGSGPSLAPVQDSQAVFDQSPGLENAHQED
ncbi:hypothetical protein SISSUDRAFT_1047589 [Sistotremastrum suecicum HHB10207 ss-3]|uniref:DUF6535 domain-containing protein n=1 Tax=Sistotremastrum suecicum HHB10207 ss-3 TaxID=1314776 RepID=A0A166D084_9AGAM|nr:hypothetical protein SISSUDRAFT_1047589 [Sistotremastrum suecicum HHB10207 ss-3]